MVSRSRATGTLAAALLVTLAASPAIAQTPTAPTATQLETITVVAPRITYQVRRERGSAIPKQVTVVEKTALVNFGDLDLTRTTDIYTLEQRVADAAAQVCKEIADQVPEGQPSTPVCVRRAIEDAMAQVQLIARMANQL